MDNFKGAHFQKDIILTCVRWYVAYPLSYRHESPRVCRRLHFLRGWSNKKYSPIERERAVRLVFDQQGQHPSQWAAIQSIASKVGCTAETLRRWVRQSETDQGKRSGMSRNYAGPPSDILRF